MFFQTHLEPFMLQMKSTAYEDLVSPDHEPVWRNGMEQDT